MKRPVKIALVILAVSVLALLIIFFVTRGRNEGEQTPPSAQQGGESSSSAISGAEVSETPSEPESAPESETSSEEPGGMSLEDFVQSDEFESLVSDLRSEAELEGSGMSLEIAAEGNVLELFYTLESLGDVVPDNFTDQLKKSIQSDSDKYLDLVTSLIEAGVEEPIVRVTYAKPSGEVLLSQDFGAIK